MRKISGAEPPCSRMRLRLSPWRHATEGRATAAVAQVGSANVATSVADAVAVGELRDFEQDLRQAVGHVDHDVVAARHLVDTPAGGRLELVASGVERRIRIADSTNVGL